jgi:hypothetical protein
MEEVIIVVLLLWLRGGKKDTPVGVEGAGAGGAGGSGGSSGGSNTTTTMTPSFIDKPTPTAGIGYRPTPSPAVPVFPVHQPPTPQVPQVVTPLTPPTPQPPVVRPPAPSPQPQVRDPATPPGPGLTPMWDDGRPAFCGREWIPLELTPCAPGRDNPLPRSGTPPPGTRVIAFAPPWSSVYYSSPSCPAKPSQGGIHYLIAGSPEWLQVCGPANPTQEI